MKAAMNSRLSAISLEVWLCKTTVLQVMLEIMEGDGGLEHISSRWCQVAMNMLLTKILRRHVREEVKGVLSHTRPDKVGL